jgi:hypothetical protein
MLNNKNLKKMYLREMGSDYKISVIVTLSLKDNFNLNHFTLGDLLFSDNLFDFYGWISIANFSDTINLIL